MEVAEAVARGKRSPNTLAQYRYRFDRHIAPGLGQLLVRELTVGRADRLIKEVYIQFGSSAAKTTRTTLSGVLGLAVRHDALERNPVREVGWIESEKAPVRSLSLAQALDLRAKVHSSKRAHACDLVDFTDFMLATGLRIGEASAVTWDAVDLDAGTIEVRGTVIRVRGEGLRIKWKPKSKSGYRTLELPGWAVAMLRRRWSAERTSNVGDAVFTAPEGGLRDPSNTQADLREIFTAVGYEWVTSHVYRKTVATLMDGAGLSARQAADQLGHAKVSMTQDNYFGRRTASTGAAHVLSMLDVSASGSPAKSGG
jgi:integrase